MRTRMQLTVEDLARIYRVPAPLLRPDVKLWAAWAGRSGFYVRAPWVELQVYWRPSGDRRWFAWLGRCGLGLGAPLGEVQIYWYGWRFAWRGVDGPIGISPLAQLGVTIGIEDAAQRRRRTPGGASSWNHRRR